MYKKAMVFVLVVLLFPALSAGAPINEQFEQANISYINGDYEKAVEGYTTLLETYQQESPSIYYNLGNAYFQISQFGMAVWCYERALRHQTSATLRSNAEFNLVRSKEEAKEALRKRGIERHHIFERQPSIPDLVFGLVSGPTAAWIFVIGWGILFGLLLLRRFQFMSSYKVRNLMLPIALLVVVAGIWALAHAYGDINSPGEGDESIGIVVTNTQLRSGLEADAETESIPDGLTVDILDNSHDEYFRVSLFDGTEGWILKSAIKEI